MNTAFELDHSRLAADSRFADLAARLSVHQRIDSRESFNAYCREACALWKAQFPNETSPPSEKFRALLAQIGNREPLTIHTSWGGVVVTLHEHPRVEKYLVIRQGEYLALEKHAEKDERLEIHEGAGLLFSRQASGGALAVEALAPGGQFHFPPGIEHCIIGTGHLLVFERSTDPKGMDQDLISLYEPDDSP